MFQPVYLGVVSLDKKVWITQIIAVQEIWLYGGSIPTGRSRFPIDKKVSLEYDVHQEDVCRTYY
jgi:hypothetical protein